MKYYITTLAINEPYFSKSLEFHKKLSERTEHAILNITCKQSDIDNFELTHGYSIKEYLSDYPRIQISTIETFNSAFEFDTERSHLHYFPFNVNLKVLSLKACLKDKDNFDYALYLDADWDMYDHFDESKVLKCFETMEEHDVDFVFERPAQIGPYKTHSECFFPEKIKDYNVLDHDLWDEAHVVNEQILLFKNNWKFRLFVMNWEQFLWYSIANNINNYAEGFEIGVSALEAKMKWSYYGVFEQMSECFYFYDRYKTHKFIKF
jgi:hypothetical protein